MKSKLERMSLVIDKLVDYLTSDEAHFEPEENPRARKAISEVSHYCTNLLMILASKE